MASVRSREMALRRVRRDDEWPKSARRFGLLLLVVFVMSCGSPQEGTDRRPPEAMTSPELAITLGDIDPDLPADRIRLIQPLADHLAHRLTDSGFGKGQVIIARDIDEMAVLLRDGRVDIFLDTIFPTMAVREAAGSEVILRRAVKGVLDYWSVFITQRIGGPKSLDDLAGKVVAFQEAYSTSGYFLPAGILRQRGVELIKVGGPDVKIADHQTGYVFSRDEENTLAMVLDGTVAMGAISSQDYEELTVSLKERLAVVDRTLAVPRTLVSVRGDMPDDLVSEIRKILLDLRGDKLSDEEGAWTWSFATLSESSEKALLAVGAMLESAPEGE